MNYVEIVKAAAALAKEVAAIIKMLKDRKKDKALTASQEDKLEARRQRMREKFETLDEQLLK